jgi:apolipoprotein N-acyltransferase
LPVEPGRVSRFCYPSCVGPIRRNAWLLAALSGVLQVLIFPLPSLYVLCWVAFTPLLLAVLHARKADTLQLGDSSGVRLAPANFLQGFLLGYVSGIIWYAGTCYWVFDTMHQYGGLGVPMALGVLVLFCLYLALYHGFFGGFLALAAGPQRVGRTALIAAPFLWVAMELARTRITGFPWDLLGTVQVDNIPLSRIARITGVYGISFEIVLVNTALAAAFIIPRARRTTLLVAGLAAAVTLQAGRLMSTSSVPADHAAYLVQQNIAILPPETWTKEYFVGTLRDLTATTLRPAQDAATAGESKPDLIVWPESPAPFYTTDPLFRETVSSLALHTGAWVVTGSVGVTSATMAPDHATEIYNSAALVSPRGEWTARYDKVHLVPFGEYVPFKGIFSFAGGLTQQVGDYARGQSRAPLDAGGVKLGVFICYESVFPDEVRQFARNGAQVLVNISNDGWYGDSGAYAQHLMQSRMRAVENQRWLLLDTNTGVTATVDPNGRIVAQLPRKVRATLRAPYGLTDTQTFYSRHGDWFAYLCAIISVVILLMRIPHRVRKQR